MPKDWGKQIFTHGSFPEVGQKQKTERKKEEERLNDGNNNGQATHGSRKHAWRTQAAWANNIIYRDTANTSYMACVGSLWIYLYVFCAL